METFFILFNLFIYLFIFSCVGSLLLHADFLQLHRVGAIFRCGARASHCSGFSCCGAQALGTRASVVVARGLSSCGSRALERRLSSCGAWAQLLRGMWDLPGPWIEPVSSALAGGFLTTAPPGKSGSLGGRIQTVPKLGIPYHKVSFSIQNLTENQINQWNVLQFIIKA